jgi:hypothetical protein
VAPTWIVVSDSALARIVLLEADAPRELARLRAKEGPAEFARDIAALLDRAKAADRFCELALVMPAAMLRAVCSHLGPARHDVTVELERAMVLEPPASIARAVIESGQAKKARAS